MKVTVVEDPAAAPPLEQADIDAMTIASEATATRCRAVRSGGSSNTEKGPLVGWKREDRSSGYALSRVPGEGGSSLPEFGLHPFVCLFGVDVIGWQAAHLDPPEPIGVGGQD